MINAVYFGYCYEAKGSCGQVGWLITDRLKPHAGLRRFSRDGLLLYAHLTLRLQILANFSREIMGLPRARSISDRHSQQLDFEYLQSQGQL